MAELDLGEELNFDEDGSGCFGCSRGNPDGLQLRFYRRGDSVVCPYTIPDRFHGAPQIAHGGIVATILDEVSCAVAFHIKGTYVVTGELSVRYEKPCPVERPLTIRASAAEQRPKYWIIEGEIELDGEIVARSQGKFFPVAL